LIFRSSQQRGRGEKIEGFNQRAFGGKNRVCFIRWQGKEVREPIVVSVVIISQKKRGREPARQLDRGQDRICLPYSFTIRRKSEKKKEDTARSFPG